MKMRKKLHPGQKGTRKLQDRFGERLVAVRYYSDDLARRRFKTVELLVEELPWVPTPFEYGEAEEYVFVRIGEDETELNERISRAGAWFDPDRKLWRIRDYKVSMLGLGERVVARLPLAEALPR